MVKKRIHPNPRPARAARPAEPLYRQLMDRLTRQIETGQLPPGGRAPSEAELRAAHGVSSTTARRCLNDLATQGLLERQQGRGTFVRLKPAPPARPRMGVVYHDLVNLTHGFAAAALRGVGQVQAAAGVDPVLVHLGQVRDAPRPAEALAALVQQQGIGGLLLLSPAPQAWLVHLLDRDLPIVSLNFGYDDARIGSAELSTAPARRALAERLHDLGHRHVLEITGQFDAALTQGLRPRPAWPADPWTAGWVTAACDYFQPDQLRQAILRHLARPARPTAIVCRGYDLALATRGLLAELGWPIPQSMSLAFIGAAPLGADIHGHHVPIMALAAIASAKLVRRLTGQVLSDVPDAAALACQAIEGVTLGSAAPSPARP